MHVYNVIVVLNETGGQILMCRRRKPPYKGLLNFVGGKAERGETGLQAAYRELREETSIPKEKIHLFHLMDYTYYVEGCRVEVYAGRLHGSVRVAGEENELCWVSSRENFFDCTKFAGDGNIGHIFMQLDAAKDRLI